MSWPSLKTYDRITTTGDAATARDEGFEKSYLGMRLVIGAIGVALPSALVFFDKLFVSDPVRGSMSAYYHSSARDLFVGGLAVSGLTLMTYLFMKWWTWDFLISFIGGLAVLTVAGFPTARYRYPGTAKGELLSCSYSHDNVPPCTALQQSLGEGNTRMVHVIATAIVVASFAALCAVFAVREFGYGRAAHELVSNNADDLGPINIWRRLKADGGIVLVLKHLWRKVPRTVLYLLCLTGVVIGAAWGKLGANSLGPHGYVGEFCAFTSFGTAWIVASYDLIKQASWVDTVVTTIGRTLGVED